MLRELDGSSVENALFVFRIYSGLWTRDGDLLDIALLYDQL